MSIKSLLFPEQSRQFPGKRWLDIILRSLHLVGLLGLAGGIFFQAEQALWLPYLLTTLLSGLAMVAISLWSNAKWMLQNRGLAIVIKLSILSLLPLFPHFQGAILIVVVIISGISSHAPAKFRYYSLFHGHEI